MIFPDVLFFNLSTFHVISKRGPFITKIFDGCGSMIIQKGNLNGSTAFSDRVFQVNPNGLCGRYSGLFTFPVHQLRVLPALLIGFTMVDTNMVKGRGDLKRINAWIYESLLKNGGKGGSIARLVYWRVVVSHDGKILDRLYKDGLLQTVADVMMRLKIQRRFKSEVFFSCGGQNSL